MKSFIQQFMMLGACAWRLRPHLRAGRYLLGAVVASSLLAAVLEGAGVSLLVPLLSLLLGGEGATPMRPIRWAQTWLPGHSSAFYVTVFCLLVLGAIFAKNVVLYTSQMLGARLKRRIAVNLRDALFQKLHHAELSLFEQRTSGELANVCFGETARTTSTLDLLLFVGQRGSIGIFYLTALFFISWPLTLITLVLAGGLGFSVRFIHRRLAQSGREMTEVNQRLSTCLVESFAGIRVVRATNSQAREVQRFHDLSDAQASLEQRSTRYSALQMPITETLAVAGAMVIIGCAYSFFVRPGLMLSSHLLGFGFILIRLLPLVNQLYSLHGHILFLAPGVAEVERWLESPQYPARPFGTRPFQQVETAVEFEQISYTYPNGTQALTGVTFRMPAGKTVALVGASGSGKSTAATLLLRLRTPTAGRITVDGHDYCDFAAATWHGAVAVVEQEAFLFHDTMARNIGYGFPEVSLAQIEEAMRLAYLEDVINELPEGLDTVVGERGTLLSGGQRQRLAIARALVRDPRILILDEATSALDNISERQVQAALEKALQGRTVLVIAHRLSTIRNADHIVVLDRGRVTEQGTWEELVALSGNFEKLVKLSVVSH